MSSPPSLASGLVSCLAGVVLLGLGGCGFTPLYADDGDANGGSVQARMDEVEVGIIPDRTGQLLRQSLQDQLQVAGAPTRQLYMLSVSYSISEQGIGVQQDTSTTRDRFVATASWTLSPIGNPDAPLVKGSATTQDALNVIDQQYFATELESGAVDQQIAETIAGQISTQVAAYFKTHPDAG